MQQKHKLGLRWLTRRQTDGKRKAAKKRGFPRHETVSMYIYIYTYIYTYIHITRTCKIDINPRSTMLLMVYSSDMLGDLAICTPRV